MTPVAAFEARRARVEVYADRDQMGCAAGARGAELLREALARQARARVIVACAPSQEATMATFTRAPDIDWARVELFHMDEYVGLSEDHPASFRFWLQQHVLSATTPGRAFFLNGDAADPQGECRRYAELLRAAPIDLCFLGFGENGHIAFNDPHEADFDDPLLVKVVTLDERCRAQQVAEGHFPDLAAVPRTALTLTCPALLAATHLICSVPGLRKAAAVRDAIEKPRSRACPASAVCDHSDATLCLDRAAASLVDFRGGP